MPVEFEPYDNGWKNENQHYYRLLRDEAPVSYHPKLDFWTLSRFADVMQALQKPRLYSSAQGIAASGAASRRQIPLRAALWRPVLVGQAERWRAGLRS